MDVHFPPELQAKLERLAGQQGRDAEGLVHEAVERLLEHDEWFGHEVQKGLDELASGEMIEHDEVGKRLEEQLAEKRRHR